MRQPLSTLLCLPVALLSSGAASSRAPAKAPARHSSTPPRMVARIDLVSRLLEMYRKQTVYPGVEGKAAKGAAFLQLCARRIGKEGTPSFGTNMTVALTQARPTARKDCKTLEVEADLTEFPTAWVRELHEKPISEVDLLTDGAGWFLFTSYSSTCCESFLHNASVSGLIYVPENTDTSLFVAPEICSGSLAEGADWDLADVLQRRGVDAPDARPGSVAHCIGRTDPSIITWTAFNGSCFVDYGKCLKPK